MLSLAAVHVSDRSAGSSLVWAVDGAHEKLRFLKNLLPLSLPLEHG